MKIDDLRKSSNIEDRRGQRTTSSMGGFGGMGGSNFLLRLLLMPGNWKMKAIILLFLILLGGGGYTGILNSGVTNNYQSANITTNSGATVNDEQAEFVSKVFASTEDYWKAKFQEQGKTYEVPTLVFYDNQTNTGCGVGQASAGPFYCSADKKVYLDLSFYDELSSKYGASGDFAMAYVIAHEVGHHVQNELGTMTSYYNEYKSLNEKDANALNVRLELQADYYAGAWANYVKGEGLLEQGDFEEAMTAAHAVGDDTLQEQAYGRTVPDSFTHGTSEQRQRWFNRGYEYGDIEHGDTFSASNL